MNEPKDTDTARDHTDAPAIAAPTPRDERELAAWIHEHLGVRVPDAPIIESHSAPLDYLAHAFFEDRLPRDCIVWANRGGGKTFYAAIATLLDMLFKPGIQIRILAGSLEQAKRMHTHLRAFLAAPELAPLVDGRITERKIALTNGSLVELLAQSQTSVRGTRVQKLRCDEVELFDPEIWDAAQLTIRETTIGGDTIPGSIECLSTLHVPFGLMHKLVTEARENDERSRRIFLWGVVDVLDACADEHACVACPLENECAGRAKARDAEGRTPGHISVRNAINLKSRVDKATWDAEMLCLRPRRSDCVLPEFDPSVHVARSLPDPSTIERSIAGMDLGIRAPTVVVFAHLDRSGVLWVAHEYIRAGVSLDEHADAIHAAPVTPEWIGIDPAARQRGFQTGISDAAALKKRGLTIRDTRLSIHDGLTLIRARLSPAHGSPTLMVHRSCEHLIKCLESYHYPRGDPFSTTPKKDGSDHAVDALRYMIQNLDKPYRASRDNYL